MIGQTISHYKITGKLGEGGMGVVYKAEDTSLERPVALKFLAPHLVSDEEVRKRFEREAKAAAALNHPNVCTVHEIAEANGRTFIAMAFIEGDSLEAKIEAGPLKLKDALDIAIQTAQGLQAAHEKKIVHRDIKPANLMVTGEGAKQLVTIMDFGLALLTDRSKLTKHEETMGTVTYMSPEQAQGMDLDHRTDVWSLGAVIYEMVTGQQAFKGHYDQATVYSILNEDPEPMTALRTGVPMELEWIVGKCLAKDIDNRYQNSGDMVVDLRNLQDKLKSGRSAIVRTAPAGSVGARHAVPAAGDEATGTRAQHAVPLHSPGEPSEYKLAKYRVIEEVAESDTSTKYLAEDTELHRSVAIRVLPQSAEQQIERAQRRKLTLAFGVGALGVLLALIFAFSPAPVAEAPLRRFTLPTEGNLRSPSISPNGRHVAYLTGPAANNRTLWVQDLDQNQPRAIVGPTNLTTSMPFWSPDSQFVGFRLAGGEGFKKVAVSGGPVVTLAEARGTSSRSAWTPDGESVIFTSERKLFRVPARGGQAELWLEAEQEGFGAAHPAFFSPSEGTDKLLYVEVKSASEAQVIALDRTSGQREILAEGWFPVYAPSGHVVYASIEPLGIWAIPFSVDTMKATGNPFPISEGSSDPSIGLDGTLVYLEGATVTGRWRLVSKDREGNRIGEIGEPHDVSISYPGLSPDGSRVVVQENATGDTGWDIWVHEMNRPIKTRLTDLPSNEIYPSWSPQGDRIIFSSGTLGGGNHRDLYIVRADGSEDPVLFLESPEFRSYVTDWSSDGNTIVVWRQDLSSAKADIWYLRRKEGGDWEESPFLQTEDVEQLAKLSPDGRFIAYDSDRSGEREVYVRSFPDGTGVRRVSANGGSQARWRKDGKELFYVEGDSLMAVPVTTSPTLTIGAATKLFSDDRLAFLPPVAWLNYDVAPDGQRFILLEAEAGESDVKLRVVQNWYEEFRDREQD